MTRFVLKNTFIKIYVPFFDKYFYKNKELKLDFVDRVVVLNDFFMDMEGVLSSSRQRTYILYDNIHLQ